MSAKLYRVAIVGAGTLKGKELKDTLNQSAFPAIDIRLLDDDESLGQLDAVGDEITFVQAVTADSFADIKVAFFASDAAFTRRHWKLARDAGALVVDLSGALGNEPGAALRSPWTSNAVPEGELGAQVIVLAHPAAVVLALLLERARAVAEMRAVVATVFEPASEQGRRGMDELHQQTVNLLSFQSLPTAVYDAQVAFNPLARYGEKSAQALDAIERRIAGDFQKIASPRLPIPSLMLAQAPIFHGHVFSVYIELAAKAVAGDFAQALKGDHIRIAAADESPSNVGAAGLDDILVSLRLDPQQERGLWLWAAADNLRVQTVTAVEAAQQALEMRKSSGGSR